MQGVSEGEQIYFEIECSSHLINNRDVLLVSHIKEFRVLNR